MTALAEPPAGPSSEADPRINQESAEEPAAGHADVVESREPAADASTEEPGVGEAVAPAFEVEPDEWTREAAIEEPQVREERAFDDQLPGAEREVERSEAQVHQEPAQVDAQAGVDGPGAPPAAAAAVSQSTDGEEAPADAPGAVGPPIRGPAVTPARRRGPAARRSARTNRPPSVPPPPPPAAPRANRWMVVLLSALTVAVIALAVYALSLGRRGDDRAAAPTTTAAGQPPPVTLPPGAFTTFRDDETGFSIRYPSAWERFEAPMREIRLLVADGPHSVRIRSRRTEVATTPENLSNLKAFADGAIAGPTTVVLQQGSVTVNGLIGFRYLYTFTDPDSGIQGAHLHYFLFQGHKMHDLIFQALPTDTFAQAEGIFNQMLESFRSDPEPATTTPAPLTDAPAPSPGG